MIDSAYRKAAEIVAGGPVSIEPDGTIWADSDHRDIEEAAVMVEYERIISDASAARLGAIAHARSLGFTDAMISAMYPALIAVAP